MVASNRLEIVLDDITRLEVDAIVNAANSSLPVGGWALGGERFEREVA